MARCQTTVILHNHSYATTTLTCVYWTFLYLYFTVRCFINLFVIFVDAYVHIVISILLCVFVQLTLESNINPEKPAETLII